MQITARIDYAVRAVLQLAAQPGGGALSRAEIADAQGIPSKYLDSILIALRQSGLLVAQRGAGGGYSLARPATDITIADVVRSVDGPLAGVRGLPPESVDYEGAAVALRDLWVAVRASLRAVLERTTVADVVAGTLPGDIATLLAADDAWLRR
jgi:Rrf2 family protein